MKTRQGFVSNSSSTSFLAVGYKAKPKVIKPADYRPMCEEEFSHKAIIKFAVDYKTDDDPWSVENFDTYPDLLWKELWNDKKNDDDRYPLDGRRKTIVDIPKGLEDLSELCGDPYVGVKVNTGYECSLYVDADKMISAIEKVRKLAPQGAKIEVLSGENED